MTAKRGTVTPIRKKRTYKDQELADLLADKLHDLPDTFLACRDMKHAWEVERDYYVEVDATSKGAIRRTLACVRCGMLRNERYAQTRWGLDKVGQSYQQPEGYGIHGVPRGVKPSSIIQGEQFRRSMEKVAEASRKKRRA